MHLAILDEVRQFPTPVLSDALDTLGLSGGLVGIRPMTPIPSDLIAGPAYTIQFEPVPPGTPAPAADYIDEVLPGSIVLLANAGRMDCTVWGGVLTVRAKSLGVHGTVIDGCCRDIGDIRSSQYPVFARSVFMRSGKNRARMVAQQVGVEISGVAIQPGDIVAADENGVLVIPQSRVEEVLVRAREVQHTEELILQGLESGETLREARRKFNYNRHAARIA